MQRRFRREREARLGVTASIAVAGLHHNCCRVMTTTCMLAMTRFDRATKGVVTLTGTSVSLYEVSGASTRDAIDERETNVTPMRIIIQRRYFTEKTPR